MFRQIDVTFDKIATYFSDDSKALALVNKAYNFAKKMHGTQTRKDGTPYIGHPIDVALILARLNFDENVVSAAMLHDVVEDCDCDLQTITNEFNANIAEMVDCVSAIDEAKYVFDKDNLYESRKLRYRVGRGAGISSTISSITSSSSSQKSRVAKSA